MIGLWFGLGIFTGILLLYAHQQTPEYKHRQPAHYIDVDVESASLDPNGIGPFTPGTGYTYVIVQVEVENYSGELMHLAPVLQTYLTDDAGNRYEMAPDPIPNPLMAGPVANNTKREGALTYNVPTSAHNFTFHFDIDSPLKARISRPLTLQ